jgi:hypothetical protein
VEPEEHQEHTPDLDQAAAPAPALLPRRCTVVREELHIGTLLRPDCCILATATLLDVLDYFKLPARPLTVEAWVCNPPMHERIIREGMPTPEEAEASWFPEGCYSLCVGTGEKEKGKWAGHLVAVLADRVLMDLTLDQANRPDYGIVLPMPVVAPVPRAFLDGEGALSGLVGGCRVAYTARPGDRSFEHSNDWKSRKRRTDLVGAAIRRLKKEF